MKSSSTPVHDKETQEVISTGQELQSAKAGNAHSTKVPKIIGAAVLAMAGAVGLTATQCSKNDTATEPNPVVDVKSEEKKNIDEAVPRKVTPTGDKGSSIGVPPPATGNLTQSGDSGSTPDAGGVSGASKANPPINLPIRPPQP